MCELVSRGIIKINFLYSSIFHDAYFGPIHNMHSAETGFIDNGGYIDYRTLVVCGRSKCGQGCAAEEAARHGLTNLDRRGPHPRRRGGQSCQYIDIDVIYVTSLLNLVTRPRYGRFFSSRLSLFYCLYKR